MDKKDELGKGYSLDDFGLSSSKNFDEDGGQGDLHKTRGYAPQNKARIDSGATRLKGDFSDLSGDFKGDSMGDFGDSNATSTTASHESKQDSKEAILQPISHQIDKQSEIGALFVAYAILILVLVLFMPQIYLANNIYYASKNINYLKSQREALRDENGDLQQKLESLKFNFLTLEIEEIKE